MSYPICDAGFRAATIIKFFCGASHRQPAQGGIVNSGRRGVLAMAKTGLNAFFQPVTTELGRSLI
jgi:hypothetical protein